MTTQHPAPALQEPIAFGTLIAATLFDQRVVAVYAPVRGDELDEDDGIPWTIREHDCPEVYVNLRQFSDIEVLFDPTMHLPHYYPQPQHLPQSPSITADRIFPYHTSPGQTSLKDMKWDHTAGIVVTDPSLIGSGTIDTSSLRLSEILAQITYHTNNIAEMICIRRELKTVRGNGHFGGGDLRTPADNAIWDTTGEEMEKSRATIASLGVDLAKLRNKTPESPANDDSPLDRANRRFDGAISKLKHSTFHEVMDDLNSI